MYRWFDNIITQNNDHLVQSTEKPSLSHLGWSVEAVTKAARCPLLEVDARLAVGLVQLV